MPRYATSDQTVSTRVLRLRLKDRHANWLRGLAFHVNQVWNYANELGYKVWQREQRFISAVEIDRYSISNSIV
jgi:putative transposase